MPPLLLSVRKKYPTLNRVKSDFTSHTVGNFQQANDAYIRMIRSLSANLKEQLEVQKSFDDLLKRQFIVPLMRLPTYLQESIKQKPNVFIPTSIAYKASSHSKKVCVCWDSSRKTGVGVPLNSQLLCGQATYSTTQTILKWRRGKFALSCDIY